MADLRFVERFEDKLVGKWLSSVRTGTVRLTLRRLELLEQHMGHLFAASFRVSFETQLQRTVAFQTQHGQLPNSHIFVGEDDSSAETAAARVLGEWLDKRRMDLKAAKLTAEHTALLDQHLLGWRGVGKLQAVRHLPRLLCCLLPASSHSTSLLQAVWEERLTVAVRWFQLEGRPPQMAAQEDGIKIGLWLQRQRMHLAARRLPDARIHALDATLPGWRPRRLRSLPIELVSFEQSPHEQEARAAFARGLDDVAAFIQARGRIPRGSVRLARGDEEQRLASWVHSRRYLLSRGQLSAEDEAQLDDRLPGWRQSEVFKERDKRWQAVCAALLQFTQLHGRLPRTQEVHEGERVGLWLREQHDRCRAGTLSPERERALAAVRADWATVRK